MRQSILQRELYSWALQLGQFAEWCVAESPFQSVGSRCKTGRGSCEVFEVLAAIVRKINCQSREMPVTLERRGEHLQSRMIF